MHQDLLEAVMSARAYTARNDMCCNTFVPTSDMLQRFNADMHESGGVSSNEL
jgi:hypothetical protein